MKSFFLAQTLALRPDPGSLPPGARVHVNETGDSYTVRNGAYVLDGLKLPALLPGDLVASHATAGGFDLTASLPAYAEGIRFQHKPSATPTWAGAPEIAATADSDQAQVSEIDFAGLDQGDVGDTYFLVSGASGLFYVWFNVNSLGTDPEVADATGVEVAIGASANASQIAAATASALDALADFGAGDVASVVTITDASVGFRASIGAGTSGALVAVTTRGIPVGTVLETVTGLDPETSYDIRVRAEHTLFDTAWSNPVTISTLA